jgi:L-alanine-DL-glutamate epimerase-like enolase superfamily enzyme
MSLIRILQEAARPTARGALDRAEEMPIYLLGHVDTALWDLAGRLTGLPTWQVLGGYRTSIPAYASTTTFSTLEEFLEERSRGGASLLAEKAGRAL